MQYCTPLTRIPASATLKLLKRIHPPLALAEDMRVRQVAAMLTLGEQA